MALFHFFRCCYLSQSIISISKYNTIAMNDKAISKHLVNKAISKQLNSRDKKNTPGGTLLGPPPIGPPHLQAIDRKNTSPLLLRVFAKLGSHHSNEDFAVTGKGPNDEVQIYTWKDATLRELTDLVKELGPAARRRDVRLSFAFVYLDKNGHFLVRWVRSAYSNKIGKLDDAKALIELDF